MSREAELREQALRVEEDRGSRLREELLITREDLSKACLERDMLHSQKMEADNLLASLEKGRNILFLDKMINALQFTTTQCFILEERRNLFFQN